MEDAVSCYPSRTRVQSPTCGLGFRPGVVVDVWTYVFREL